MRIGIDYTSAVRQRAGIGRYTRGLIRTLAQIDGDNQYILFSAGRGPEVELWPPNFSLRTLPISDRHLAMVWQRLRLPLPVEWVTGRIDILHSPDFVLPPVRRAATVLTVHDLSFMRHPECSSPALLRYLMRSVPHSIRRADVLLADSKSTRADLIDLMKVPGDRIQVLYPAVETRFTPAEEAGDARILGHYGIRKPYILALGTLQPRKNFARLIRAFATLVQGRRLPHQLVIGGARGWLYDEIEQALNEAALGDAIRLIGYVDEAHLPGLYRGADVFAFPSLYEGFGIPILEAMACGTPVVTSAVSSMPEAAGEAALLVSPEDTAALAEALWRLIDEQDLRNDLRTRGFVQARRFGWHASAKRLLEIYAHIGAHGG
ncbi:MAG: glycosyltransferase family 4 protein [Anaerolineae bacterium]|nr:glycosyltransferase family 4 protein [Anaerolineae bacterium]